MAAALDMRVVEPGCSYLCVQSTGPLVAAGLRTPERTPTRCVSASGPAIGRRGRRVLPKDAAVINRVALVAKLILRSIELSIVGFHLARHGIKCTPLPCCRQNTFGSLPRGMPTVVDESMEVRVRELEGDTERKRHRFRQVQDVKST